MCSDCLWCYEACFFIRFRDGGQMEVIGRKGDVNTNWLSFYKLHNGLSPSYLSSLVPPPVSSVSRYNLRNSNSLRTVQSRTSVYYNSFLPVVTSEWNDLSDEVKNSPSLNRFKYNIKQRTNRKVPSYFYAGTIQLQIYHARLKMKCRSLNNHLYMRNIVNSPFVDVVILKQIHTSYLNAHSIQMQDWILKHWIIECYFWRTNITVWKWAFI